jgi:hypothetical protein
VWDAVEVVEFTRKHTASIHESFAEMRRIVEQLVAKRDERRDGFVKVIVKAMHERLGADAEEVMKVLVQRGISRTWAKQALQIAEQQGRFTIFSIVDALTRMAGEMPYVGERTEIDQKAAGLLTLGMTHIRLAEATERQLTDSLHTAWRLRVDMNEKGSSRLKKPAKKKAMRKPKRE